MVEMTPKAARAAERIYGPLRERFYENVASYSNEELALLRDFMARARELSAAHLERITKKAG